MGIKKIDTDFPMSGNVCCVDKNTFGVTVSLYFTKSDFNFSSFTAFADQGEWLSGIASGDIIPISCIEDVEDLSDEAKYYDSPIGRRVTIFNGKYRFSYKANLPFDTHKKLQSLSNQDVKVFKADLNGNVIGTSSDGIKVEGFTVSMVNVEKLRGATADSPSWTVFHIEEDDPKEINEYGVCFVPDWSIYDLDGIVNVLTEGVIGVPFGFILSLYVYADCGINEDGSINQMPISGLLESNIETNAGAFSSFTDEGDGNYIIYLSDTGISWSGKNIEVIATNNNLYKSNQITL